MRQMLYSLVLAWMLVFLSPANSIAQEFSSGSNGSFGAINLVSGELAIDLPPDGILHATTIHVGPGTVLRFNRNPLNTTVHLLAQGDVSIEGTVDVSGTSGTDNPPVGGKGGPGGFDGGTPGILEIPPGDGHGPGGGKGGTPEPSQLPNSAGSGSYATRPVHDTPNDGAVYGSPLVIPLAGGSGGGGTIGTTAQPGVGGGGGGGAILISSSTKITITQTGAIVARGGFQNRNQSSAPNSPGSGSGGAIRLVATTVEGTGTLDVRGGLENNSATAGSGYIRIDTILREGIRFNFQPSHVVSIGSFMTSFPLVAQRLDIVEVAGRTIEENFPNTVQIVLPFGSETNRTITVQARGFTGLLPIQVALTPDSGNAIIYDATIDMSAGETGRAVVNVDLPVNTVTSVYAWTK